MHQEWSNLFPPTDVERCPKDSARKEQTMGAFPDLKLLAKLPEDRMLIDLKNYGNLYEELVLKNYAITGNYLDEPTLKSDFSLCQNLNS